MLNLKFESKLLVRHTNCGFVVVVDVAVVVVVIVFVDYMLYRKHSSSDRLFSWALVLYDPQCWLLLQIAGSLLGHSPHLTPRAFIHSISLLMSNRPPSADFGTTVMF